MKWSYGITAVYSRLDTLLADTITSLDIGGFGSPTIFLDGTTGNPIPKYLDCFDVIDRPISLGAFGNFVLGMWELYLREPNADRYAMFQDDLVCYKNLRHYLEQLEYPKRGYWNLFTWEVNVKKNMPGFSLSDQFGRGAVALVFDNEQLRFLLQQPYFINHRRNSVNGHKAIDKAVIESFKSAGRQEWVHNPSLVQHTGVETTVGNSKHPESPVWNGENFDAMELLNVTTPN